MDQVTALAKLRDLLAYIYNTEAKIRVVCSDADLKESRIEFSGSAVLIWHSVLHEAELHDRIPRLLNVITANYPSYQPLHDAIRDCCTAKNMEPPNELLPAKSALPRSLNASVDITVQSGSEPLWTSRPIADIGAWLERVGFVSNPFAILDASHEAVPSNSIIETHPAGEGTEQKSYEPRLPGFFVETPLYLELVRGNPAEPVLLVHGEGGTGKTALRRMLIRAWQPLTSAASVLAVEVACCCWLREAIEHDWQASMFPQFLNSVMRGSVENIVHALLARDAAVPSTAMSALQSLKGFWLTFGATANDPSHFYNTIRDDQVDVLRFTVAWNTRRMSNLLAATTGWDRPGLRNLAALVDARPIKPASASALTGTMYRQLIEIAVSLDLPPIQVLIDCLDEPVGPSGDPEAVVARLAPIVGSTSLIDIPGVAFRFFLPLEVVQSMQQHLKMDPNHVDLRGLAWEADDLHRLLVQRLSAFSDGKIADIAQLCDDDLASDFEPSLIRAAGGVPRKLLRLLENVIVTHCLRAGGQLRLTQDDWKAAQLAFATDHRLSAK